MGKTPIATTCLSRGPPAGETGRRVGVSACRRPGETGRRVGVRAGCGRNVSADPRVGVSANSSPLPFLTSFRRPSPDKGSTTQRLDKALYADTPTRGRFSLGWTSRIPARLKCVISKRLTPRTCSLLDSDPLPLDADTRLPADTLPLAPNPDTPTRRPVSSGVCCSLQSLVYSNPRRLSLRPAIIMACKVMACGQLAPIGTLVFPIPKAILPRSAAA